MLEGMLRKNRWMFRCVCHRQVEAYRLSARMHDKNRRMFRCGCLKQPSVMPWHQDLLALFATKGGLPLPGWGALKGS